jgi:hypothetical protein
MIARACPWCPALSHVHCSSRGCAWREEMARKSVRRRSVEIARCREREAGAKGPSPSPRPLVGQTRRAREGRVARVGLRARCARWIDSMDELFWGQAISLWVESLANREAVSGDIIAARGRGGQRAGEKRAGARGGMWRMVGRKAPSFGARSTLAPPMVPSAPLQVVRAASDEERQHSAPSARSGERERAQACLGTNQQQRAASSSSKRRSSTSKDAMLPCAARRPTAITGATSPPPIHSLPIRSDGHPVSQSTRRLRVARSCSHPLPVPGRAHGGRRPEERRAVDR